LNICGLLRVRNEARWIRAAVRSIMPVCSSVIVMDDHSEDDTAAIAAAEGATVLRSPFDDLNEARDKTWLVQQASRSGAQWIVMIDGDEELVHADQEVLIGNIRSGQADAYALKILYLWDRPDQWRTDGVYGRFRRPSVFRVGPRFHFWASGSGQTANFHCSSVPQRYIGKAKASEARLLHYGYMHREDRLRKFEWYNRHDPGNAREDRYRHVVQGDIASVPADAKLLHAGPLKLEPLEVAALACR
jgi:glycosyltransferase involved in cell wall biosynthesis